MWLVECSSWVSVLFVSFRSCLMFVSVVIDWVFFGWWVFEC